MRRLALRFVGLPPLVWGAEHAVVLGALAEACSPSSHAGPHGQQPGVVHQVGVVMPVIATPQEFNEHDLYVDLESIFGWSLFLKCEGMNFAGSVKLKAATAMVEAAERAGTLQPGSMLVESSSGNLGVALSMIAANKGYGFVCVTDSRCNLQTKLLMEALGAQVHIITEPDPVTGLLGARMDFIRALCAAD